VGTFDLPALALGHCAPSCLCVYFRQITRAHVITITSISKRSHDTLALNHHYAVVEKEKGYNDKSIVAATVGKKLAKLNSEKLSYY